MSSGIDKDLVHELTASIVRESTICHLGETALPDQAKVAEFVELCRRMVFPGFFGRRGLTESTLSLHVEELLCRIMLHAREQIASCLRYASCMGGEGSADLWREDCAERAGELSRAFVNRLPELRRRLALDVQAGYDNDPAAEHTDELIFCYPGIDAIFSHRVAHTLYRLDVPLLPRIIQEAAHSRTGIDIHPGASIGESFFIDHGGGVVIGETTQIGDGVRIYQGVTLGALSFHRDDSGRMVRTGAKRHPTLGNRVTVYAGAVILGGDTVIGDDCVISGGVFVRQSVPAGHLVRQKQPELVMRTHTSNGAARAEHAGG